MPDPQTDSQIYRELSAEMRAGLKQIYHLISNASLDGEAVLQSEALFTEASDQLKEVVKATENAAMDIMDIVENQLDQAECNVALLENMQARLTPDPELATLKAANEKLVADLTRVLTILSFQDITGQRIKRVLNALNGIETSVVDLYLASGLVLDVAEKHPEADIDSIKAAAQKALEDYRTNQKKGEQLKGPDANGQSQAAIDDMLAQLGL